MGKPNFLFLLLGLLLVTSLVSAAQFDNVKDIIDTHNPNAATIGDKNVQWNDLWEKYPPVRVDNVYGLGKKLFEGAITEHTEVCNYDYCYSIMEIYTSGDDAVVDDITFKTQQEDGSWTKQDVRRYNFLRYTGGEQILVDDYEYQCTPTGETSVNRTAIQECANVKVGEHYEESPTWSPLALGEVLPEGNYKIKLEAWKKPGRTVDWVIETNGEWIEEWAVWGGLAGVGVDDQLNNYYTLDETSGTVVDDSQDRYDLTNTNSVAINEAGKIGTAYHFDGATNYLEFPSSQLNSTIWDGNFSMAFWLNPDSLVSDDFVMVAGAPADVAIRMTSSNNITFSYYTGAEYAVTAPISTGAWQFFVVTRNKADGMKIYSNNTLADSDAFVGNALTASGNTVFGGKSGLGWYDGLMDEVGVWTRTLNVTEVGLLYNSGDGAYPFGGGSITLNSPANASTVNNANTLFNATATVTGGATLVNISLWNDDGGWSLKNSTNIIINETFDNGLNYSNIAYTGGARTGMAINVSGKDITLIGATFTDSSNANNIYVGTTPQGNEVGNCGTGAGKSCNFSSPLTLTANTNYYITTDLNGGSSYNSYWNNTQATTQNSSYFNWYGRIDQTGGISANQGQQIRALLLEENTETSSTQKWNYTIPAGDTIWNVQACDSDGDCGFAASNYTVTLDSTAPTVTINEPSGTVTHNGTIELNTTITDTNLNVCWYEYNNTNTTFTCGNIVQFVPVNQGNITVWANDTIGNTASASSTFTWNMYFYMKNAAGSLIDRYKWTINGSEISGNPVIRSYDTWLGGLYNNTLSVIAEDLDGYSNTLTTSTNFNASWSVYNYTLTAKSVNIKFFLKNGSAYNVTQGFLINGSNSIFFSDFNLTIPNIQLKEGLLNMKFGFNNTEDPVENYSQIFDFVNDWGTHLEENLTVLESAEQDLWIKITNPGGASIPNAKVKLYGFYPNDSTSSFFVGQGLTDDRGMVFFFTDSKLYPRIIVEHEDYITWDKAVDTNLYTTTEDSPFPIRLEYGITELFKGLISLTCGWYYDDTTSMPLTVLTKMNDSTKIEFNTSFNSNLEQFDLDDGVDERTLTAGTHFNASETAGTVIYLYVEDVLWGNITAGYMTGVDITKFNEPTGLSEDFKKKALWIALLFSVGILGLLIKGEEEGIGAGGKGKILFFMGAFIISIISGGSFTYLLVVTCFYFLAMGLKKVIKE